MSVITVILLLLLLFIHVGAGTGVDLRRRLHVRYIDVGHIRRRSDGRHVRGDDRIHAVPARGVRFAVPDARLARRQRRRAREHGPLGSGAGHQMDQGERGRVRGRPGDDHVVRRIGWRRIGKW